jgi:hypothetical protein
MSDLGKLTFPGLDQATGNITLPLWVAGVIAAALLICLFFAIFGVGWRMLIGSIAAAWLLAIAGATGYTFSNRSDRDEERRALDRRMLQLTASAIAPGSVLACLNANFSETVEDSCEKTIFGSPDTVAVAFAYVNARLSLLTDGLNFASRRDAGYESTLVALRRAIEADRFGFVAQVLATREGCTFAKCDALALLRDADRIRSNLNGRTFDELVARNASNWPQRGRSETPIAAARPPGSSTGQWNLPSSSSIPPVSIMNEPAASAPPVAVPAPAARRQTVPPRTAQPRPQQTNPAGPPPPIQLAPPSGNDETHTQQP